MTETFEQDTLRTTDPSADGHAPQVAPAIQRGTSVHRYVVLDPIGQGGMGTIYKAYDPELDRRIAIKILSFRPRPDESTSGPRERLLREAQALAQLSHPNVIAVYDVGTLGGTPLGTDVFIAMELLEGKNLRQWMKDEAPSRVRSRGTSPRRPRRPARRPGTEVCAPRQVLRPRGIPITR